jgi:FkbM family methyltransferase
MPHSPGTLALRRPHRLDGPFRTMLLNAVHDRHKGRVFLLEVGAGTGGDDSILPRLRGDGWSGLLIEPHPDHFARLEALHATSERVAALNLGISDIAATLPLHALTPEAAARFPKLSPGRASLIRDRIAVRGTTPDDIASVDVPFLRLDTVLRELGLDRAQVVIVNAGGHEEQVLRSFDLAALQPTLALVASVPGTAADLACLTHLRAAGLAPYRLGSMIAGLAPGLMLSLDDLLTFFNRAIPETGIPHADS